MEPAGRCWHRPTRVGDDPFVRRMRRHTHCGLRSVCSARSRSVSPFARVATFAVWGREARADAPHHIVRGRRRPVDLCPHFAAQRAHASTWKLAGSAPRLRHPGPRRGAGRRRRGHRERRGFAVPGRARRDPEAHRPDRARVGRVRRPLHRAGPCRRDRRAQSLRTAGSWADSVGAQVAVNGDFYKTGTVARLPQLPPDCADRSAHDRGDLVGGQAVPVVEFQRGLKPRR